MECAKFTGYPCLFSLSFYPLPLFFFFSEERERDDESIRGSMIAQGGPACYFTLSTRLESPEGPSWENSVENGAWISGTRVDKVNYGRHCSPVKQQPASLHVEIINARPPHWCYLSLSLRGCVYMNRMSSRLRRLRLILLSYSIT